MLRLSVVTPSLNQGRFIERTIRSVLDQGYAALEYVVCDGGSTDTTPDILARYAARLRVVSEADRGQADAVNKGFRLTSGDVIGWLNSDDVYMPGALVRAAEFLTSRPDIDVVYGDALLIGADDAALGVYYTEPWNPQRLPERCFLCQPAVFFRRTVVDHFGGLDERLHYCMDYEYWLRVASGGARFAYLPEVLAAARLHPETKSLSARLAVHLEIDRMLHERLHRVPEPWLLNHAHTVVELERAHRHGQLHLMPYALAVILAALHLSLQWNGSLSGRMLATVLAPLARGVRRRLDQWL